MVRRLIEVANTLLVEEFPGGHWTSLCRSTNWPLFLGPSSRHDINAPGRMQQKLPDEIISCDMLISSGSLIMLEVVKKIGDFDTSLFIDHVDNEWFLRARHHGYSVYVACGITLTHRLGTEIIRYWLGHWRTFPAHPPIRHYYMLRNTLLLARRPHVPLAWLLGAFSGLLPILAASLLLLPNRGERLSLLFRAIYDGLRNRGGAYDT